MLEVVCSRLRAQGKFARIMKIMNKKVLLVLTLLLSFFSNAFAAEEEEEVKNTDSEFRTVVKEKAQRIKDDSREIQKAFERDMQKSAKVISAETDKIKGQVESLKKEFKKHGDSFNESGKKMQKVLESKQKDLEEALEELDDLD